MVNRISNSLRTGNWHRQNESYHRRSKVYEDYEDYSKIFDFSENSGIILELIDKTITDLVIPSEINGARVKIIGDGAFEDCKSLTSVTISDGVTYINWRAFRGCTSLTNITIPDSVTSIDWEAFRDCTSLKSVTIPDSVTQISSVTFANCTSLTSITIPNSVTEIGAYAFANCTSLKSITIPDSVTRIGGVAFRDCMSLRSVTIGNSVAVIGECAFDGCTSLTNVTIGNSVQTIEFYAFRDCTSLNSVTIPNSVKTIGRGAFEGCTFLKDVKLPESVELDRDVFKDTPVEYLDDKHIESYHRRPTYRRKKVYEDDKYHKHFPLVTYQEYFDICKKLGWSIEQDGEYITISQYSPEGEDFSFTVHSRSADDFPTEVGDYAFNFDPAEHATDLSQSGLSGVPEVDVLVDDAREIKKMLDYLSDELYRVQRNKQRYNESRYTICHRKPTYRRKKVYEDSWDNQKHSPIGKRIGKRLGDSSRDIKTYKETGLFANSQIYSLNSGLKEGADPRWYATPEYDNYQMEIIIMGLLNGLDVSWYATPEYDYTQMMEIHDGLLDGLPVEWYASPQFDSDQMYQIRKGLSKGMDVSQYASPDITADEMEEF